MAASETDRHQGGPGLRLTAPHLAVITLFSLLINNSVDGIGLEPEVSVQFSSPMYSTDETSRSATIEVVRIGNTNRALMVDFTTGKGSAMAGADFTPQAGTLWFAAGETNQTFSIPILDDPLAEGTESVELALSNPTNGAVLGTYATARLMILDNERRGSLWDRTFFHTSIKTTEFVNAIAIQTDGKVLVTGGFARSGIATTDRLIRLNEDGTLDNRFRTANGSPNNKVLALAVQRDGKVVIGGAFTQVDSVARNRIARLNADASLDMTFNPGSGVNGSVTPGVYAIALQDDGKVLIGGNFDSVDGTPRNVVARLNADGSLDRTFNAGAGVSSADLSFQVPWVSALAVQTDGRVMIGGQFTAVDGLSRVNIARLNADGSGDASFDPGTGATGDFASVVSVALQPDGKVIIGGDFAKVNGVDRYGIARLDANGSIDTNFDYGTGVMGTDATGAATAGVVTSLAIQDDGKVILGGEFTAVDNLGRPGLARLNADGSLDTTFGPSLGTMLRNELGYEELELVSAVAAQPDGRILIGGRFVSADGAKALRVVRLLDSNIRSTSFEFLKAGSSVGEISKEVSITVVRRGDSGNLAMVGFATSGGTATPGVDYAFRSGTLRFGPLEVEKAIAIPILDDGNVEDDETFNVILRTPSAGSALGSPTSYAVRIIDNKKPGNLDFGFAQVIIPFRANPTAYKPVMAIMVQDDAKVLVAGHFTSINGTSRIGMVRLETDGTIDPSFVAQVPPGASTLDFHQMGLQSDGRIVGGFEGVSRLNLDGSVDTGFLPDVGSVNALAVQTDGKFLVAEEYFDLFAGRNRNEIVRFLANGLLDTSFSPPAETDDWVNAILPQPDGKVLVGGYFSRVNGEIRYRIARLNIDGSLDETFDVGAGISGPRATVNALVLQADRKIIVVGDFNRVNNINRNDLVRLNPDGSVDTKFAAGTGPNNFVETVAVQPDGKVLIGGGFTSYDGVRRIGLARLERDGTLDADFEAKLTFPGAISLSSITLQADAKILIGGLFTAVNGVPRAGLARLNGDAGFVKLDPAPRKPKSPFRITLTSRPGKQYRIEASTDLVNWVLITIVTAEGFTLEFEDPDAAGPFGRFYRAVLVGP